MSEGENCVPVGVCNPQGLCLLQQQLMAASIAGFENLVKTTHNQDIEYLKTSQLVVLAVLGNPRIFINPETPGGS